MGSLGHDSSSMHFLTRGSSLFLCKLLDRLRLSKLLHVWGFLGVNLPSFSGRVIIFLLRIAEHVPFILLVSFTFIFLELLITKGVLDHSSCGFLVKLHLCLSLLSLITVGNGLVELHVSQPDSLDVVHYGVAIVQLLRLALHSHHGWNIEG